MQLSFWFLLWQESICGSLEVAKRYTVHIDPFQQNFVQYFFHSQLKTIFTLLPEQKKVYSRQSMEFLMEVMLDNHARTYLQPHYGNGVFGNCLPFSWTTLRGKHCRHPIAVMGVVDMFGL